MKKTFFIATLIFSSLAMACHKCPQEPIGCIDESKIRKDAICPAVYDPVCGCDGITYGNDCEASSNGVMKWTKGHCNSTGRK